MKTEAIRINNKEAIRKAVDVLNNGGIIVYPTETSYGIGVDATNDAAVDSVIRLKKRDKGKKILIAFSDLRMAKKYLVIGTKAEKLAKAFMPGPLSLIVESREENPRPVGFRIPGNKFVLSLIRKLGKPVTSTSANISGKGDNYKIKNVIRDFDGKVGLIIDGGDLAGQKPSTVYDTIAGKILRKGPISEKQIKEILF